MNIEHGMLNDEVFNASAFSVPCLFFFLPQMAQIFTDGFCVILCLLWL